MQVGNSGWVPLEHPQGFVNCNMPLPQIEAKHREGCVNPRGVVTKLLCWAAAQGLPWLQQHRVGDTFLK